jgi:hypothetical protein
MDWFRVSLLQGSTCQPVEGHAGIISENKTQRRFRETRVANNDSRGSEANDDSAIQSNRKWLTRRAIFSLTVRDLRFLRRTHDAQPTPVV